MSEKRQPLTVPFSTDDRDIGGAISEARRTVDRFIAALMNPGPNQKAFSVKVAFKDGEKTEHLWLAPVRYENGSFVGRINNEPQHVKTVSFDDEIAVAKDEISDWIYAEGQRVMGGYTARVLLGSRDTQASVGKHELNGSWSFVSINRGTGPHPKPGFHLEVTDTKITFIAPNGARKNMGLIHRIDPVAKPHEIDLQNGHAIGFGIYELDGDSLKLTVRNPGAGRPSEFNGSPDGMLLTLKRD